MASARSDQLRALAQRIADALPPDAIEIVLTGSVSRGVADDLSDVEMLVVTEELLSLDEAFELAGSAGLEERDGWGDPATPTRRVFGYLDGRPVKTKQLAHYPDALVAERVEKAAERWGGFAPEGLLTIARPDCALARMEWLVDAAQRVLAIVFALNRVHQPTAKRLASRVEPLPTKPELLAERIDDTLSEQDPRRALILMAELQLDTVRLAPSGPNVDRAREWLAEGLEVLR